MLMRDGERRTRTTTYLLDCCNTRQSRPRSYEVRGLCSYRRRNHSSRERGTASYIQTGERFNSFSFSLFTNNVLRQAFLIVLLYKIHRRLVFTMVFPPLPVLVVAFESFSHNKAPALSKFPSLSRRRLLRRCETVERSSSTHTTKLFIVVVHPAIVVGT